MSTDVKAKRTRRKRRTTEEVLASIVAAAGEEFERNGYAGAKTAAIARRAGVAEALIFTNFGSKANIFHKSIFDPLNELLVDFCSSHMIDGKPTDPLKFEEERREYISELQGFIKNNSRKLTSLVVAHLYKEGVQDVGNVDGLDEYFDKSTAYAKDNIKNPPEVDPILASRVSFATILSCILFRDWLFPKDMASDRQIDDAVIDQVISGLRINDP